MPTRIETQAAMQAARRAIRFCYLCGETLDGVNPRDLATEHVFPRRALRDARASESLWSVTLPVHGSCEVRRKKSEDADLIQFLRIHTQPFESIALPERRMIGKRIMEARAAGAPPNLPVFHGQKVMDSVWQIVRGLHAVLYSEPLATHPRGVLLLPAPTFSPSSNVAIEIQFRESEHLSGLILASVEGAIRTDTWDGITAWAGEFRYRCIWKQLKAVHTDAYMCLWLIDTPESLAWAEQVRGQPLPFRGAYCVTSLPVGASLLTQAAIDSVNSVRREAMRRATIRRLTSTAGLVPDGS